MTLSDIVGIARDAKASDVHLIQGSHPLLRVDGVLHPVEDIILNDVDCDRIALDLVGVEVETVFKSGERDLAKDILGIRCRINLFRRQGTWSLAVRLLTDKIPPLESLGVPKVVREFSEYNQGLVLVTGKTGSGKSTTLAALLDIINHTERKHILTLEDPVEYIHIPDKCAVNQREVGKDTQTFASGLRAALREDPDVILVGELRDFETIDVAITAAETGHLVFGTVHANSAAGTIDRLVSVFPADRQRQVRLQLSMSLDAVLCQQLLPRVGGGRVVACECMRVDSAIQQLIREGQTQRIPPAIQGSANIGNVLMTETLKQLRTANKISEETYRIAMRDFLQSSFSIGAAALGIENKKT